MSASGPSTFAILPAIDLREGRVVRLRQGDFGREQVYGDDPAATAVGFVAAGASWIHVVDLDGARAGERRQAGAIETIIAAVRTHARETRVQVAGGLRTADDIADALGAGADRVVVGTSAILDATIVSDAIARHGPDRIAVALDVRDGLAVGAGWVDGAPETRVEKAIARLDGTGVATYAVTAIARDGLLGGPDLELLGACCAATGARVIASGGIRSVDDLRAVRKVGCAGAIVGRAIYDGHLDLAEAIRSVREARDEPDAATSS